MRIDAFLHESPMFAVNRAARRFESLAAQAEVQRFALEATYITLAVNVAAAAIQEASLRAQIRATLTADQQKIFDTLPVRGGGKRQGGPSEPGTLPAPPAVPPTTT